MHDTPRLWLVGGARTAEARTRGHRRFIFTLSGNPSEEWKEYFAQVCRRTGGARWHHPEVWHDELSIDILLDDREHVRTYLAECIEHANEGFGAGSSHDAAGVVAPWVQEVQRQGIGSPSSVHGPGAVDGRRSRASK